MLNTQPIEKRFGKDPINNSLLDIKEIFETIQGEGPFCGVPCVFIRLAGCNLQCPGCDTDYTTDRQFLSLGNIMARVRQFRKDGLVVITGGEPYRQPIGRLLCELTDSGYYVQIETNGTLPPDRSVQYSLTPHKKRGVYIVCSPKTGQVHADYMGAAVAFKYVITADSVRVEDGLPLRALGHTAHPYVARPPTHRINHAHTPVQVFVQPMDSQDRKINKANLEAAKKS